MLAGLRRLLGRRPVDPRAADDPPFPRVVFLAVNDACNLRCRSCDVGTGAPGMFRDRMIPASPRRVGFADLARLVDEIAPYRPTMAVTSVEPLLSPWLPDLVARAAAAGCPTQVTTNGLLLAARAGELAAAGLDALWVSLDGPPEIHDALRGRPGAFAAAAEGMRRYARECESRGRKPALHVNCVTQPGNEGALADLARLLADLPVSALTVSHLNFVTPEMAERHGIETGGLYPARESCVAGLDPARVDLERLDRELARLRDLALPFPVYESPALTGATLSAYYRAPASPAGRGVCLAPWSVAQVLADGTVTGSTRCLDAPFGNILDAPLEAIWRGEPMRRFRRFLRERPLLPACARCCAAM